MNDRQKTKGHKGQVSMRRISSKTVNIWGIYSSLEEALFWVLLELVGRWTQHFTKIDQKTRKIGQIYYLEPPWLPDLLYKHWFASSVYGIFTPESQTSLRAKHSQERRARRNGCFRRLGVFIINNIWGDLWVLQSSGNFTVLLLRSIISLKLPSCAVVLSWFCPHPSLPLDVSW